VDPQPSPVYRWLAGITVPGAVMEWPLGDHFDFEYEFRSTAHWKPLLNGYSGFGPPEYREIRSLVSRSPIPDGIWRQTARLGAALLVFHPHDASPGVLRSGAEAIRRALSRGELESLAAFSHGPDTDYVFRLTQAPAFEAGTTPEGRRDAVERFSRLEIRPGADPSAPIGALDFPRAEFAIRGDQWAYGWALDDSGIAEIRVSTEMGPAGVAARGPRPDVQKLFPHTPEAESAGFGFPIPRLPPGRHLLRVTLVGKDGGETVIERPIRVP
jgi:hypothetical protein